MFRAIVLIYVALFAISLSAEAQAQDDAQRYGMAIQLNNRAHIRTTQGDFDGAIADAKEAIRLMPDYGTAYNNLGFAYLMKERYDDAIKALTTSLRIRPGQGVALNSRGKAYLKKRHYKSALADFDEAIRLMPHYSPAYNNRGSLHSARGKQDLAIADFNEALRLTPDFTQALKNRGDAYRAQGKADLAAADHAEAERLESGSAAPAPRVQQAQTPAPAVEPGPALDHLKRGVAYGQRGEVDSAIAEFDNAIAIRPDAMAFYSRGVAHTQKRDHDKAIADFNEAIRLKPDYADAVLNRANAYTAKGDADRAIAGYTEVIRIKPDFALAYVNRGIVHIGGERFYAGLDDLAEATRIERAYGKVLVQAVVNRARTTILAGQSLTTGIIIADGGAQGHVAIGASRLVQGRYMEAIGDCEAALKIKPKLADAFLLRGASLIGVGDIERGIADLKQAARLDR